MSMMYCEDCDCMIDTDFFEFYDDKTCMDCHMKLTSKQEDLILVREDE